MTSCPKTGEKTCRCRQKRLVATLALALLALAFALGVWLLMMGPARTKKKT